LRTPQVVWQVGPTTRPRAGTGHCSIPKNRVGSAEVTHIQGERRRPEPERDARRPGARRRGGYRPRGPFHRSPGATSNEIPPASFEMVRNTAGYVGLVAGAATLIGARLAWAPAFGYAAVVYIAAPKPLRADTGVVDLPLAALDHDTGHLDRRRAVRGRSRPLREIRAAGCPVPRSKALAEQWSESHLRGRGWCESDPSLTGRGSPGRRQLVVPSEHAPGGLCR
jgi:hypothetical protein